MTTPEIRIREAAPGDFDAIATLLRADGLPARDVRSAPADFLVAVTDGTRVGAGGVERHGENGLLRSVVVRESSRGEGVGSALCDELERAAREDGVEALYLLTTTAKGFFDGRGYVELPREDAPQAIRETSEFADLCPASAVCMRKRL